MQDNPSESNRAVVEESNVTFNRDEVPESIEAVNRDVASESNVPEDRVNEEFYTPYRATEIVNDELVKLGLKVIQKQMIYQYSMTGRIKAAKMVRKNKSGQERLVWQIGNADLDEWLKSYIKSKENKT
jgi:hypothetical protein